MKENGRSNKTYYDLVRDDLMGSHPRILNLLLVFAVVSLSSVAVFLASDILSSGSHAVQKNGFGGLLQQIPREPFGALNFSRDTGKIANQTSAKTSGLNGSNKTKEVANLAGNASPPIPAVSSSSSLDGSLTVRQASGTTASSGTVAGSTNGSSTPVVKRNHSGGGQSKKASGNESRTIGSPSNLSRSNVLQLNGSQENESQTSESQPIWAPFIEPSQNQSSLNTSQPDQSKTNQSESTNQSQMNDSSNETQLSLADTMNQYQPNDLQSVLAEPKNQTKPIASLPDQSKTLTKSEGEIKMSPLADATGNEKSSYLPATDNASKPSVGSRVSSYAQSQRRTTSAALSPSNSKPKASKVSIEPAAQKSNQPEALTAHQEKSAGPKIDDGASQGELQNKSQAESSPITNQTLPDNISSTATDINAGKGSDATASKTMNFNSAQEKNNDKVTSDSSGKGNNTVSAGKSSAKIQNTKNEGATSQYRPIRAPRKPAQPRQVRSATRR